MNEVSNLFVCLMGMGTTFVGLICIIFLTMLMGKVMQKLEKPEPPGKRHAVNALRIALVVRPRVLRENACEGIALVLRHAR